MPENRVSWEKIEFWAFWQNRVSLETHKKSLLEFSLIRHFAGTPDYLAPELLLRKPHTAAVDWWGLGVCLYEFMTGVPPFSDQTPDAVFDNILALRLEWPSQEDGDEPLSDEAVEAIHSLLVIDPDERLDGSGLKNLKLFSDIDWATLPESDSTPFVPEPLDETDTGYFEMRNNLQQWQVSQFNA